MHTRFSPRSFAISSYAGSVGSLVTNDQLEVGTLSRQSDVATPIQFITNRHSLAPASFARYPNGASYDCACLFEAGCRV
jgi:hypothetical protein